VRGYCNPGALMFCVVTTALCAVAVKLNGETIGYVCLALFAVGAEARKVFDDSKY